MIPFTLKYKPQKFVLGKPVTVPQLQQLETNIQNIRELIVFMTGLASARGVGGHTGGPYDIVPEVMVLDAYMRGNPKTIYPVFFDEAGHRVAIQYVMAALDPKATMTVEHLLHYREANWKLYGHPEREDSFGVHFSSGRLGHMWGHVNGVAAREQKKVIMLGSDGSQQEGNNAEAARYCVAHQLPVLLLVDDNNVTIEGHPKDYMPGYNVAKKLAGHGMPVDKGKGEQVKHLITRIDAGLRCTTPLVLINQRVIGPGLPEVEGKPHAHDALSAKLAIQYLQKHGQQEAAQYIQNTKAIDDKKITYLGSGQRKKNRSEFGEIIVKAMQRMSPTQRKKIKVFSNDLGGSTGLASIGKAFPKNYHNAGIMERQNFLAAAGWGDKVGYQGIYATFAAFLEMVISEITMCRLNHSNVLAHFSHSGVDWMADNTCHYGLNLFFADNGLGHDTTRLYFPADAYQLEACLQEIFDQPGLRFVFSTRSSTPQILDQKGKPFYQGKKFIVGKDDVVRAGKDGYIVSYGEMLYRCLDAVEQLKKEGLHVGLINKPTLNVIDESILKKIGKSPAVLVVESQHHRSGLGMRYGSWLLQRGLTPKYNHLGISKEGAGGIEEHMVHHSLTPKHILQAFKRNLVAGVTNV